METVTTKEPKPWTDASYQQAFNTMLTHVRRQGEPAQTDKGGCRYRLGDLKCAVGAIIPDELYHPDFDKDESLESITQQLGGSPEFCDFLRDCRNHLHDGPAGNVRRGIGGTFLEHVEGGAKEVAKRYNLIVPKGD